MTYLQQHRVNRVQFWINIFIPKDVPGLTKTVKTGPHAGKTYIPHPVIPALGYLTDQRDFSSWQGASSRLQSVTTILLNGIYPQVSSIHKSDPTHEITVDPTGLLPDGVTGIGTCTTQATDWTYGRTVGIGGPQAMRLPWVLVEAWDPSTGLLTLSVAASGGNPCAPTTKLGGEVDYDGTVFLNLKDMTVRFSGKTDPLPSYEMYAQVDDGAPVTVFRRSAAEADLLTLAKGFLSLIGPANRAVDSGTVSLEPSLFPAPGVHLPHFPGAR